MKILLIKMSPVDGLNSSTLRTLALAKGLNKLDYEVYYLTVPVSNCHVINESNNVIDSINIIRTPPNEIYDSLTSKSKKRSPFKSIIIKLLRAVYHKLSIYDYTYKIAKDINIDILDEKTYDIIISSSDPKTSHIVAKRLISQGIKYNRWIQYWGDPLAYDITNKAIYSKWILKKFELNLIKKADKIVYVSPFTYELQIREFPGIADKMTWLPIPYIEKKEYDETSNDIFTIGYFGAYKSSVRNIYPLYEACKKMNNIHLDIVGDSDITLEETDNIKNYPRGNVDDLEKNADLLVCILNSSGTQIPGKIYHYAATNKPILVILDGEKKEKMREYLKRFGRYVMCDNDEKSILDAINEIKNMDKKYEPCPYFEPQNIAIRLVKTIN